MNTKSLDNAVVVAKGKVVKMESLPKSPSNPKDTGKGKDGGKEKTVKPTRRNRSYDLQFKDPEQDVLILANSATFRGKVLEKRITVSQAKMTKEQLEAKRANKATKDTVVKSEVKKQSVAKRFLGFSLTGK